MNISEIRRVNLRALADERGAAKLSRLLGYRQPSFLTQMIGPNPNREVSEKTARLYEAVLGLEANFFDNPKMSDGFKALNMQLQKVMTLATETIHMVADLAQQEGLNLSTVQFAKVVNIEMTNAAERDFIPREVRVKDMLGLMK